jgi:TPR repeat protein
MYAKGQGVAQNHSAAMSWYRKAADQGYATAQYNLGTMYDRGNGVPQDYAAAVSWYRKAAEQGHADGQSQLGFMYSVGQGVPEDYVLAHMWLNLAATSGNKRAAKSRQMVEGRMTPRQVAEAQKLAREWKRE